MAQSAQQQQKYKIHLGLYSTWDTKLYWKDKAQESPKDVVFPLLIRHVVMGHTLTINHFGIDEVLARRYNFLAKKRPVVYSMALQ